MNGRGTDVGIRKQAHRRVLFVIAALCSFFAIGSPAALGAYSEVGSFANGGLGPGGSGSGNGQLANPGQADVNDATGNLYVADTGNDRVQVFKPTATAGEYDSQAAVPGAKGLAIDQNDGSVYVATATGITKLTASLTAAAGWTDPAVSGALAVDPASGDVLVADTAGNLIRRFNSDGSADGSFAATRPVDVAANSAGDVFVVTTNGDIGSYPCGSESAVERFSGLGVSEGTLPSLTVPGAVAVDPDDDSILVATHVNEYFCERGSRPGISSFDASGAFESAIALANDTVYSAVPGLAVQGSGSSRAYAVTKSPMNDGFGVTKVTVLEVPPPTAPEVVGQSVLRGSTDATLRAQIDAGGAPTEYHFEYGTTPAYGEETAPGTLSASFDPVKVSKEISGLTPGTTYHYRVVATNSVAEVQGADRTFTTNEAGGADCPNEAFRTGASAHLTDCRAFELVTPTDSDADIRVVGGPTTPDGNTVCFNTEDALVDADPNGIKTADQGFCAWRGPSGWETKWVTGPAPAERTSSMGSNVYFVSPDGQRAVFASDAALFGREYIPPPGSPRGSMMSAYLWDAGETTWVAPGGPPVGEPPKYRDEGSNRSSDEVEGGRSAYRRPLATSEDLTHGIFESDLPIVPEDENEKVDIYEWYPGGVRLVSRDATGKAVGGRSGIRTFLQMKAPAGAVSADGSRIFFMHDGAPLDGDTTEAPEGLDPTLGFGIGIQSVYMREGDEVTLVSPRRGGGPDASVWFVGASANGETVFLDTTQPLTPEPKQPGRAIYTYDVANDELQLLADAPGGIELLATSRDGSTVVYRELLTGSLVAEHDGVSATLGTLHASDINAAQRVASARNDNRALRITPDGQVVVFAGSGEFGGFGPGPVQIYRWEVGQDVERVSAEAGDSPEKNASITAYSGLILSEREELFAQHTSGGSQGRVISDDGSRIFFETPEALVKRDVNGLTDVYEWHDGEINIISTGTGPKALYHGSSADGKTVFITTFERLVPSWDRNAKRDLYVARIDGGFAPPAAPPGCAGEACQPGQAAPPPSVAGRGASEGNLKRGLAAAALAKGGKSVRVSVLAPGRITATLSGKLGKGKPVTVAKTSKVARVAGALTLPLKLSGKAKRQLAKQGRLTLTLTVKHAQSDQTITRKVTLHG